VLLGSAWGWDGRRWEGGHGEGRVGRHGAYHGTQLLWKEKHGPLLTVTALVVLIAAAPLPYTNGSRRDDVLTLSINNCFRSSKVGGRALSCLKP